MSAQYTAEEIIDITEARLAAGMMPIQSGSICTDTRELKEGDWYLALSGEKFDGHDFLGEAFSAGATGCIVEERPGYAIASTQFPLLAVGSTLDAYHELACNWRKRINPKVIAITGSSGKTTTKEMCASVFSQSLRTHKSHANENNEFGLPKTILAMPDDTQVLVLELAMRGLGEIGYLASTALADIAVIVNVGSAHLGRLSSIEQIIQAKCELAEYLESESGVLVVGQPDELLMTRVNAVFTGRKVLCEVDTIREVDVNPVFTRFECKGGADSAFFEVKAHGYHQLVDAWCAITAGRCAGLDDEVIFDGLKQYQVVDGRGNFLCTQAGVLILDETYNANPDSVRSAVDAFTDRRAFPQSEKFLVLGEMAELGDDGKKLHVELGGWLKGKELRALFTVGSLARWIAEGATGADFEIVACRDKGEAEVLLKSRLSSDSGVLIKGSRCAKLDELVAHLVAPI